MGVGLGAWGRACDALRVLVEWHEEEASVMIFFREVRMGDQSRKFSFLHPEKFATLSDFPYCSSARRGSSGKAERDASARKS